jgi:hypothetical protein
MDRRGLLLFLLSLTFSGCASLPDSAADAAFEAPVAMAKSTPSQAYDAGVLAVQRGDYDAARREWDRCLAMSSPESPVRVDCLVAIESLGNAALLER